MDEAPEGVIPVTVALFLLEDTGVIITREGDDTKNVVLVYDHHDAKQVLREILRDEQPPPAGKTSLLNQLLGTLEHENELPPLATRTRETLPDTCMRQFDILLMNGVEALSESGDEDLDTLFDRMIENTGGFSFCWVDSEAPHEDSCLLVLYAPSTDVEPTAAIIRSPQALASLIRRSGSVTPQHRSQLATLFPDLQLANGAPTPCYLQDTVAKILMVGYGVSRGLVTSTFVSNELLA